MYNSLKGNNVNFPPEKIKKQNKNKQPSLHEDEEGRMLREEVSYGHFSHSTASFA